MGARDMIEAMVKRRLHARHGGWDRLNLEINFNGVYGMGVVVDVEYEIDGGPVREVQMTLVADWRHPS